MFIQVDELPDIYHKYLSVEVIQYVTAVVGTTKLFRSFLGNIKGKWAVVTAIGVGTGVGWIQFGMLGGQGHLLGLSYGVLGGIASAVAFFGAKQVGRKVFKLETK